jgi:hypothetical protein
MNETSHFLEIDLPCDQAVAWLTGRMDKAGLEILRTFDLQLARSAHPSCPCPHHGSEQCDCQMVVVLIYGQQSPPLTLLCHGNEGRTWVALVDTPQQRASLRLQAAVRQAVESREGVVSAPI